MSHEPSIKRLLKTDHSHWAELDGAFYVTNGFAIVRVDEAPLIAWAKASYTKSEGDFARVIANVSVAPAEPTIVLVDGGGLLCRVFRTPTLPLAVQVALLAGYRGKTDVDTLSSLTWRCGTQGVSGWSGDVCIIAAMGMVYGGDGNATFAILTAAAEPLLS